MTCPKCVDSGFDVTTLDTLDDLCKACKKLATLQSWGYENETPIKPLPDGANLTAEELQAVMKGLSMMATPSVQNTGAKAVHAAVARSKLSYGDPILTRMQAFGVRAGMKAAFDASPAELGKAAVAAVARSLPEVDVDAEARFERALAAGHGGHPSTCEACALGVPEDSVKDKTNV